MKLKYKPTIKSIVYALIVVLFFQCTAFSSDTEDSETAPKAVKRKLKNQQSGKQEMQKKGKNPMGLHIPKAESGESDEEKRDDDSLDATDKIVAAVAAPLAEDLAINWPPLVNDSWKRAAIRAAESWGMSVSDYLAEGEDFLKEYKKTFRKRRNMNELNPCTKPINATEATKKFSFKPRL